ncbi:Type 4a pilus biogenesis protein PilO [Sulfidibacter corallicola]|uniref:Type 4a pilus biogenesis protein PilO n=1 Tax=Sulfidibacter corallicola TaxID=2818388 RepID=A0A8A4TV40_SULCO|nr:type 4a pilus biogenesis protein PilO [Sulfidibacter corallicola]QTD53018.1 type 4a pilus biogenesis protein PilO [Sulfidibacter corallicola]
MKLTKLQQALTGLGIIVLGLILTNWVFLKDIKTNITSTEKKISELEQDIRVAKNIQRSAAELQEQMNHLRAQLDRLKKVLPVDINKPKFQADVKRYANENGIEIVRATNNKPVTDDVIIEHPFSYEAWGSFHDFGRFFAQLTNYPRIVNIKGLSLGRPDDKENIGYSVKATFIVSVFTYREPTPEELKAQIEEKRAAKSGKNKKGKRGRR